MKPLPVSYWTLVLLLLAYYLSIISIRRWTAIYALKSENFS